MQEVHLKRPQGYYAGKLISDAGLKGFAVGGLKFLKNMQALLSIQEWQRHRTL